VGRRLYSSTPSAPYNVCVYNLAYGTSSARRHPANCDARDHRTLRSPRRLERTFLSSHATTHGKANDERLVALDREASLASLDATGGLLRKRIPHLMTCHEM